MRECLEAFKIKFITCFHVNYVFLFRKLKQMSFLWWFCVIVWNCCDNFCVGGNRSHHGMQCLCHAYSSPHHIITNSIPTYFHWCTSWPARVGLYSEIPPSQNHNSIKLQAFGSARGTCYTHDILMIKFLAMLPLLFLYSSCLHPSADQPPNWVTNFYWFPVDLVSSDQVHYILHRHRKLSPQQLR